jgi:hypothetical protein
MVQVPLSETSVLHDVIHSTFCLLDIKSAYLSGTNIPDRQWCVAQSNAQNLVLYKHEIRILQWYK